MNSTTHVLSVSEWLKLPEVSMPSLRSNTETGTIVMVVKVGFLLATEADCRQENLSAEPGPNGKLLLPTAMIQNGGRASLHRLPTDLNVVGCRPQSRWRASANSIPLKSGVRST